jgi:hypothetical protein
MGVGGKRYATLLIQQRHHIHMKQYLMSQIHLSWVGVDILSVMNIFWGSKSIHWEKNVGVDAPTAYTQPHSQRTYECGVLVKS